MPPPLRLEYTCTPAEMDQAQSLFVREQVAGGSKWRTNLVLLVSLAGMLLAAWFRFRQIPEAKRSLLLAAIVAGSVLFVALRKRLRKSASATNQVEISETDFTVLNGDSKVVMPWSAFGDCLESSELFVLTDRPKRTLFVVPKRAFSSEDWQTWFRQLAVNAPSIPAATERREPASSSATGSRVKLCVHPRFGDSLACTLASWRTRGLCLCLGAIVLGCFLYVAANPPPNAVNSTAKVLVMSIPFVLVMLSVPIAVWSVLSWRARAAYGPQEISLCEQSLAVSSAEGNVTLPWTNFEHFKETAWVFILWHRSHWIVLPKRSFASLNDLIWFRGLLERRLKPSRWFFG